MVVLRWFLFCKLKGEQMKTKAFPALSNLMHWTMWSIAEKKDNLKLNVADGYWVKVMMGQMCFVARGLVVLICSKTEIQIQKLYPFPLSTCIWIRAGC